ncbi:10086_t:CDS:2 [Ambispora gerdemannii]|uniref:Cysteine proteinase 1, mitochondrial n=1 Tax=Ambispora gerdemannii TaxID=144530 RepID=A0A9N8W6C5_9GLOM|nr:10086_t:CDS:2 [Ambispora gerdemannii]
MGNIQSRFSGFRRTRSAGRGTSSKARKNKRSVSIYTNGANKFISEKIPNENTVSDACLTVEIIEKFSDEFNAEPKNRLALNAVTAEDMTKVLLSREVTINDTHVFSERIELEAKVTNQKSSGRCWLFAATNVMRLILMKKYNIDDLELSQPYLFFYDKLEKANFFLESMIGLAGEKSTDSRLLQYLLRDPVNDGGQWDMIINLLGKYGVVPKTAFPESFNSSNSYRVDTILTSKLREFAHQIRQLHARGHSSSSLRHEKIKMMEDVYRILAICLGEPPKRFDWSFRDREGKYHQFPNLTPKKFYEDVIGYNADGTFSLVNDPRNPYLRLYTVEYLGNVCDGYPIRYVNIPIDKMKKLAIQVLRSGKPVWFGADVGKFSHNTLGILDNKVYDFELAFNIKFGLNKEQRLRYCESLMTHAMVFTGVHLEHDKPIRWRVENSWGEDRGQKGYFVMSDDWFSEWVYQIVMEKNDAPKELVAVLDQDPITLPAWDPMGSLAKM